MPPGIVTDGLLAYYHMARGDHNAPLSGSAATLHDLSGNGNDGTLTNFAFQALTNRVKNPRFAGVYASDTPPSWSRATNMVTPLTVTRVAGTYSAYAAHVTGTTEAGKFWYLWCDALTDFATTDPMSGQLIIYGSALPATDASFGIAVDAYDAAWAGKGSTFARILLAGTPVANLAAIGAGTIAHSCLEIGTPNRTWVNSSAVDFYIECASLTKTAYPLPYFDGTMGDGYAWLAASDASYSSCSFRNPNGWAASLPDTEGPGLWFDGKTPAGLQEYVALPDLGVCEDKTFTYEAWFRSWGTATYCLIGEGDLTSANYYACIAYSAGKAMMAAKTTVAANLIGNTAITPGDWCHIVGTQDGTYEHIYLNGAEDKTAVAVPTGTMATSNTTLGLNRRASNFYPCGGEIAVARIYNKALSSAEILQNYNAGRYWYDYHHKMKTQILVPGVA